MEEENDSKAKERAKLVPHPRGISTSARIYKQGFQKAVHEIYTRTQTTFPGDLPHLVIVLRQILQGNLYQEYIKDPEIHKFTHCGAGYCDDGSGGCVECPDNWRA